MNSLDMVRYKLTSPRAQRGALLYQFTAAHAVAADESYVAFTLTKLPSTLSSPPAAFKQAGDRFVFGMLFARKSKLRMPKTQLFG